MRGGDAKPRRAARLTTNREPRTPRARGLGPRAFSAKRRTPPPSESAAFARLRSAVPDPSESEAFARLLKIEPEFAVQRKRLLLHLSPRELGRRARATGGSDSSREIRVPEN